MLIFLGAVILLISFVVALISMIREQRKVSASSQQLEHPPEVERHTEMEHAREEVKLPLPDANHLDVLKSRIDELARQEADEARNLSRQEVPDVKSQDQHIDKDAYERAKLDELLAGKKQNTGKDEQLGATSGTISIADLVKEKGKSEDNSS